MTFDTPRISRKNNFELNDYRWQLLTSNFVPLILFHLCYHTVRDFTLKRVDITHIHVHLSDRDNISDVSRCLHSDTCVEWCDDIIVSSLKWLKDWLTHSLARVT